MGLILLRHTTPDVPPGTCYGRRDVPLCPGFAQEAEAVLASLPDVSRIVTSPATRCRRLAARAGTRKEVKVSVDFRLAEMDFGAWEGRPWASVPQAELDAWARDFFTARPHGGESVASLIGRTRQVLAAYHEERVLAVTHAGIMRAARYVLGDPDPWHTPIAFGACLDVGAFSA
ncbi:alpha-ribazole phosphatase [Rhodovulum imhoffii]|uniref:Alpha-ribazole phosphatase n=1 Tax=Rhodovulum imhoffii TaxID=365340 RepID=A0A2T5BVG3_9RHOB|nr:alpha-ribazole phosphatase family protein [Rhodovulum imhoffii]MBK5934187.1 hypothetical protein [Rhodovulum imhoffii]PTN03566.1 alpha-ribazole phosphatase [Rhodovulum imhoffii]